MNCRFEYDRHCLRIWISKSELMMFCFTIASWMISLRPPDPISFHVWSSSEEGAEHEEDEKESISFAISSIT